MFQGAIAAFLNRLLGRYVEDLDTEQLNIGIFSGDTCLTDLKLKPEALYQLGLPIRVEAGLIGKIILKIPWSGLLSQPVVICIEDIFVVAVSAVHGPYDADLQKRLTRAEKRKILEDLEGGKIFGAELPHNLFDGIVTSIMKNFQITINNVHIRYEEELLFNSLCACGICIQSISMTTTNNKWKPGVCTTNSQTLYELIRVESLSMYMDHDTKSSLQSCSSTWDIGTFFAWKSSMLRALQTFGMKNKEFQFLLKPFTAKIKVIIHKGTETQSSRMLIDIVLQDIAMQISEVQYVTFCQLYDSLLRVIVNRRYRKYRPDRDVKENSASWWKYAYYSILENNVRPYSWESVARHRKNYKKYKDMYIQNLLLPNDTELKLDMQKFEDNLTILNVIIAREHARQQLYNKDVKHHLNKLEARAADEEKTEFLDDNDETNTYSDLRNNKSIICRSTENGPSATIKLERLPKSVDYKYNFTLANCSVSLLSKNKEVLVITITQFLTSIEVTPKLSAFKLSARAESFVIEGVSSEGDLVPLVIVDNVLTGNVSTNFLALDFEKNEINTDPSFNISIKLETIEITYHHYVMTEIINFFKFENTYIRDIAVSIYEFCKRGIMRFCSIVESIASQTLRVTLKIDIGGPYIIFPEYGSVQKGGYILVLDFGNVLLTNELQAVNVALEDATLMELEELLYDRLHINFSDGQILFCHSGDDWRCARMQKDSEHHFLAKVQANATLSYSIKPEYHQLPRYCFNIAIENKNYQVLLWNTSIVQVICQSCIKKYKDFVTHINSKTKEKPTITSIKELRRIQYNVCLSAITMTQTGSSSRILEEHVVTNVPKLDRSVVSSEVSEEDLELLSKTINLSGFDDSVSPCNHINLLLRLAVGELSFNLGFTNDGRDEPYLNLRLHTMYLETAITEYGYTVQFGIGSILLIDKTDAGVTGSYLELLSTGECNEVFMMSYRKVRSDCPDFKSFFKNIERSLLLSLLNVTIILHKSALVKANNYWKNVKQIFHGNFIFKFVENICSKIIEWKEMQNDPPIPAGAIKLNYSARIGEVIIQLCDKELDLMKITVSGFENNCIYNANERMVLRMHLRSLYIEDLSDETFYANILTTDEDKVFDLKYVRHIPKLYACPDIDTNQDDVMSDGVFKLSVGRINCVFISKIFQDLQYFAVPFISSVYLRFVTYLKNKYVECIEGFKRSTIKLHISVDIQGPTFLLPQRKDAPNLLVLDTGTLSVENFFKKIELATQQSNKPSTHDNALLIIDNILLKLKSMTVSRAIMTLSRDLEMQESIIEPVHVHFDVKRRTECRSKIEFQAYELFRIQGFVDHININLSQRDLKSIILIWRDNISKVTFSSKTYENEKYSSAKYPLNLPNPEDVMMKKLQVFLAHNEAKLCEISIKLTVEGMQLNLFLDTDEVLSSPVRDLNHGLCKLSFGEVINTFDFYNNHSLQMKLSLQSCILQDTRKDSQIVKKIIQSPAKQIGLNVDSYISVSLSPIVDISFSQASTGDKCFDILIQETRINLSIPFMMHLGRYFIDSLPSEQTEAGIVNHGYEGNSYAMTNNITAGKDRLNRAQFLKEQPDMSVSVRIQKPEILLFGNLKTSSPYLILLQAEINFESSRHSHMSSIVCTFSDIRAKSKNQGSYTCQSSNWLLRPTDAEISKKEDLLELKAEVTISMSSVNVHLSPGVLHTFIDIINEVSDFLTNINLRAQDKDTCHDFYTCTDLWTPKKISHIPYKKVIDDVESLEDTRSLYRHDDQILTFYLKPILMHLYIEMETTVEKFPILQMECIIVATVIDWYNNFSLESVISVCASSYDVDHKNWEPLIELCTKDDVNYKPWELTIKMQREEAFTIDSTLTDPRQCKKEEISKKKNNVKNNEEELLDMVFISPDHAASSQINGINIYSGDDEDSDTDEECSWKKLSKTTNYLFNDKNESEEEDNDSADSSTNEDEAFESSSDCSVKAYSFPIQIHIRPIRPALYVIVSAEDQLNFTITPNNLTIINTILNAFVEVDNGIPIVPINIGKLILQNNIGQTSKIELLVRDEVGDDSAVRVLATQDFQHNVSPASTPSSPEVECNSNVKNSEWITNDDGFANSDDNSLDRLLHTHETFDTKSPVDMYKAITGELIHIIVEGFEDILLYCPKRQDRRFIPLRPAMHDIRYHLVIEVTIDRYLHRTISVRSPLQFRNETSYALSLYYKKQLAEKLNLPYVGEAINPFDDNIRITIIEPDSTYNVPLYIAYHFPVHVLPAYLEKYQVSDQGIYWKELSIAVDATKDISCKRKNDEDLQVFSIKAVSTEIPMTKPPGCQVPNYLINIIPPLVFNNQLPFVVDIHIPRINYEMKVEPGEKINMHSLECNGDIQFIFKIQHYLGTQWTGTTKLNMNLERKYVQMYMDNESDLAKPFLLCIELCKIRSWYIIVQAQYWLINKSGLPLFIQECHVIYEMPDEELMIFSQKTRKKNVVRLRAHQSEWSLPFALDGISSMSLIVCMDIERGRKYRILTEIDSSRLSPLFTKIITFLPYFFVNNKTKKTLRFMEENETADLWNDLLPGQEIPFWPVTESMKMRVKWKHSQLVSQHFDITRIGKTVLRMDSGSALCVEVEGGVTSPYYIIFKKYTIGDIPVRVDNLCDELFLKINQINSGQVTLLNPLQSIFYTWDDPSKSRELMWNIYNNKKPSYKARFETDGFGHEVISFVTVNHDGDDYCPASTSKSSSHVRSQDKQGDDADEYADSSLENKSLKFDQIQEDEAIVFWVRSRDKQSDDADEYANSSLKNKSRKLDEVQKGKAIVFWVSYMEGMQRVLLFTQHASVYSKAKTIIDPEHSKREIFLSIAGVGISIISKSHTTTNELIYGSITSSTAHWELCFGKKWKGLSLELSAWMENKYSNSSKTAQLDNFIDVDLTKMHMTKPFYGKLRRTYSPGIWMHYRESETFCYLQGHIHRLQVDNQVQGATFPIVLNCNWEQNFFSYAGNRKLKHCIEFICLKQEKLHYTVYKGINIVVRKLNLNLQEEFLLSLIDLIPKKAETKHSIAAKLRKDVSNIHTYTSHRSIDNPKSSKKTIIESIYISPIIIHLRLLVNTDGPKIYNSSDLTDYRNTVRYIFEFADKGTSFERNAEMRLLCYEKCNIMTSSKRFFLDLWRNYMIQVMQQFHVLFRLTTVLGNQYGYNFKSPRNDFHDPNSLLIYGEDISEKLCYDVACFLGHATVDITQMLLVDLNNCSSHVYNFKEKESFLRSTDISPTIVSIDNSFSSEIELQLSGLVTVSTNSVRQEEMKYLMRTLGKKMSAFFKTENPSICSCSKIIGDIMKRIQESEHKFVSRTRLPRHVGPYTGIELFSLHKAKGMHLLSIINKGHGAHSDTYWAHTTLSNDGKYIALISLQRIYLIEKASTWGSWNVKWDIETNNLLSPPIIVDDKLVLHVNKNEEASSAIVDWYLESKETDILEWLCRKINTAMVLNMESSICSKQDV